MLAILPSFICDTRKPLNCRRSSGCRVCAASGVNGSSTGTLLVEDYEGVRNNLKYPAARVVSFAEDEFGSTNNPLRIER